MPKIQVSPFHCGSQSMDWENRNCRRCKKIDWDLVESGKNWVGQCEVFDSVSLAAVLDGKIPVDIAERMGMTDDCTVYTWDCPERDTIE